MVYRILAFGLMLLFCSCSLIGGVEEKIEFPQVQREFRAAWVATVANIDWPSRPGLSVEMQKKEMIAILDKCVDLNMNAIVFQVRPQCDALYDSRFEPWSYYLSGEMGKAPSPYYDPLTFTVEEGHARGIEVHVWFNPYRANHPANKSGINKHSIVKKYPELVVKLGSKGYWWMDPALKGTQDHSINVVMDVVKRYDVDGIHFDDYFYPYSAYNDKKDFPDDKSWKAYQKKGGMLSRGDWRRDSVNKFIKRLYNEIKSAKPHVKFGISPFGIWKPGYPEGIKGMNQYETLFADARLWLEKGWVDYYTPQLYWAIDSKGQPYKPLLNWWTEQNKEGRNIWPGNYTSRIGGKWKTEELINQIKATREQEGATGNVHFSMKCFMQDRDNICEKMKKSVYQEPALVPASPWLSKKAPGKPVLTSDMDKNKNLELKWKPALGDDAWIWVCYIKKGEKWDVQILPYPEYRKTLTKKEWMDEVDVFAISAVDRNGIESPKTILNLNAF
jgi:uncharacterized lipoprotein YddW (UPF0748 family)